MSNIVIVGSGPAGVSAALYAVRAGVQTTVLTKGSGALARAEKIENYYGFAQPVSGQELERRSIENARRLGAAIRADRGRGADMDRPFDRGNAGRRVPGRRGHSGNGCFPRGAPHPGADRAGRPRRKLVRSLRRLFATAERTWRCWAAASTPCMRCRRFCRW